MAKRITQTEAAGDPKEVALRVARTAASFAIRLRIGDARERFLEMRPEAEHATDHYEFNDSIGTLTPAELWKIAHAIGDKSHARAIRAALCERSS